MKNIKTVFYINGLILMLACAFESVITPANLTVLFLSFLGFMLILLTNAIFDNDGI